MVVCDRNCEPNPQDVVDCLKGFRTPLQAEFDMAAPQQLVTVYTGEIPLDVVSMANTLHGIALPLGTVVALLTSAWAAAALKEKPLASE